MFKNYRSYLVLLALFNFCFVFSQNDLKSSSHGDHILEYLEQKQFNLNNKDLSGLFVDYEYVAKNTGITHVYLGQQIQGVPVRNAISSMAIKNNKIAYFSNTIITRASEKINTVSPALSSSQAVFKVLSYLKLDTNKTLKTKSQDGNTYVYSNEGVSREDIPVKLVFTKHESKKLLLAWEVIIATLDTKHIWNIKVDAVTGVILSVSDQVISCNFDTNHESHKSLGAHKHEGETSHFNLFKTNRASSSLASGYNVFPMPTESPNHGTRALVTDPENITASPYGWHDTNGVTGAEFTITRGNNVYAQEDVDANNGFGYAPDGGASLIFDFPYSPTNEPLAQQDAAITNLFYWNNIMHDVYYQYGFDEPAGNFQENNYGKGGVGGDYVIADAQDGNGTNNANFSTPADGGNGRMQMYLWTGGGASTSFSVNSPSGIAGIYASAGALFGASSYDITGNLVLVDDGTANPNEGCNTLVNGTAINGNIAVLDRGSCEFGLKALNAQNAGAIAVVVVNNTTGVFNMGSGANGASVTIPVLMISQADGATIKAQLPGVSVTLQASPQPMSLDGDFDNGIIAHEYGHGISTRLAGGPGNSGCLRNEEQMGEGWSDWFGLMLTIESGDTAVDRRGIGTYASGESTSGNGIRSFPYSTDMSINPHTYDAIKTESVPHGVGSVWSAMIWDLTWTLIDLEGYDADVYNGTGGNNIALHLVLQGLKLQPCSPGFVDGRDAILAADELLYEGAYRCAIWEVFARRGLGFSASQGSSASRADGAEAFDLPTDLGLRVSNASDVNIASEGDTVAFSLFIDNCNEDTDVNVSSNFSNLTLDYVANSASNSGAFNANAVSYPTIANLAIGSSLTYTYEARIKNGSYYAPMSVFQDNMDAATNWTESGTGANAWTITSDPICASSSYYCSDIDSNSLRYITLDPFILNGVAALSFNHSFNTEENWDGGFVEITNDGGITWNDLAPYFDANGYNGYVNDNPSTPAFSGNSNGCITTSTIPLIDFPGTIQIRFKFATDASVGGDGWYIDNVSLTDHAAAVIENTVTGNSFSDSEKQAVLISPSLSVKDMNIEGFSIYPNPTSDVVFIQASQALDHANVSVYDVLGRNFSKEIAVKTMESTKISVDLSQLASGLYFVSVENNGLQSTKRIIKN